MEALRSTPGRDSRDQGDGLSPSLAASIRYLRAIVRRLSVPHASRPSQIPSREMLERFALMLRCGF
jgi:hypothetical protein